MLHSDECSQCRLVPLAASSALVMALSWHAGTSLSSMRGGAATRIITLPLCPRWSARRAPKLMGCQRFSIALKLLSIGSLTALLGVLCQCAGLRRSSCLHIPTVPRQWW